MIVLHILGFIWLVVNIPIGVIAISIACFVNAEYFNELDLLLYPMLIYSLREKLSMLGTVITTTLFSIFFMPAIIVYFIFLSCFSLAGLVIKGFIYLFRRKG